MSELTNRKITLPGVGALVLHGDDTRKQDMVLDALASAEPEDIVGLLMGTAFGADEAVRRLYALDDPALSDEDRAKRVAALNAKPWPADAVIELDTSLDDNDPDPIQKISFDLEPEAGTLGGAMVIVDAVRDASR